MSYRPESKHREIQSARAPWKRAEDGTKRKIFTHATQEEIEVCLECPAAKCTPRLCPQNPARTEARRPQKAMPENFLYYGRVESLKQLEVRYGVSHTIIERWRRDAGIIPETKRFPTKKHL